VQQRRHQHQAPDPPAPTGVGVVRPHHVESRLDGRLGGEVQHFRAQASTTSLRRPTSRSVTSTKTKDRANSTVETAAASRYRNWLVSWKTNTGAVRVRPGMFPDTMTMAPNSPRARANASNAPAATAGRSAGSMTFLKVIHRPAPR